MLSPESRVEAAGMPLLYHPHVLVPRPGGGSSAGGGFFARAESRKERLAVRKDLATDSEFVAIAQSLLAENRAAAQWAEVECDDWVQTRSYQGGFDATEMAFTFCWRDDEHGEWLFQVPLEELAKLGAGGSRGVELRRAGG